MDLLLTARSGFTRGASWVLRDAPLVIGRSPSCDIVVHDKSVSRAHCEAEKDGEYVRLTDKDSRNPTLANGVPVKNALLQVGDEFSVGSATFLVASTSYAGAPSTDSIDRDDTVSASIFDTGLFPDEDTPGRNRRWMGDIDDYQMLFQYGRAMSLCGTVEELLDQLRKTLGIRFGSSNFVIARKPGPNWVPVHPTEFICPPWFFEWCDSARQNQRAYVASAPDDSERFLVAPLRCGPTELGVCALEVECDERNKLRSDLVVYSSICELTGPTILNLERIERLAAANLRLIESRRNVFGIVGSSRHIVEARAQITEVAGTELNVLIAGETGTGKELAARAIHEQSPRSAGPYIVVNCAAIPEELLESEFFGHARGAFTGAVDSRKGFMELAHLGTLVLDEVGELSPNSQAKLLRVVERQSFRPVGDNRERSTDVRVIGISNRDLRGSGFRQDLYHRLAGVEISLPPLRQRKSDIPQLTQHFLDIVLSKRPELQRIFSSEALEALTEHDWPGNVRELRNTVERAAQLSRTENIAAKTIFGLSVSKESKEQNEAISLVELERQHIVHILTQCSWNISKAARILGIGRSTLYQKISDYELRDG